MSTADRKELILSQLKEASFLSVEELSRLTHASEATIRRDLTTLEEEGLVQRKRGGASYVNPEFIHWPLAFRNKENYDEKIRIARIAARLVEDGISIFLDSSSTCLCLAQALTAKRNLTAASCSVPTVEALAENDTYRVECSGGIYTPKHASMRGPDTCSFFQSRFANIGFVSALGFSTQMGLSDYSTEERAIKRAIRANCRTLVALVDHSKMGATHYLQDLSLSEIDILVTDQRLPDDLADACYDASIRVLAPQSSASHA